MLQSQIVEMQAEIRFSTDKIANLSSQLGSLKTLQKSQKLQIEQTRDHQISKVERGYQKIINKMRDKYRQNEETQRTQITVLEESVQKIVAEYEKAMGRVKETQDQNRYLEN